MELRLAILKSRKWIVKHALVRACEIFSTVIRPLGLNISVWENSIHFSIGTSLDSIKAFIESLKASEISIPLIRLGDEKDGGYIIPEDLDGITSCFSPGVNGKASFEQALAHYGIRSFMADNSVDSPPIQNDLFVFTKKHLGHQNNEAKIRFDNWISENDDGNDSILQMDIDGPEYEVLPITSIDVLKKFRIICLELHYLDRLPDPHFFKHIQETTEHLLSDFKVVHIHPNNFLKPIRYKGIVIPPIIELTLLRKDRNHFTGKFVASYPHPLDKTNDPTKKDFILPSIWW